ncbi:MAG: Asp-tRNA(Asn)/Glu-tRNA(Gln) amidotransferase subunit GatC [Ruaniaceae bacterium]|nr:Asp-tRNA(Asn)/Glu-tRNA(Gln) amidotransferase subunit GatC [Ruaniaceae bacterium]
MSTINREEVARVAALALIDLTEEELDRFAVELQVIAQAVITVSAVATADIPATSHPIPMANVMRDDVPGTPLSVEAALSGAPVAQSGRFAVPQILGDEA